MGPHIQHVEDDARIIEQSVRDAFAAHVNPALTRLAQEIIKIRAETPFWIEEQLSGAQLAADTAQAIQPATQSLERIESLQVCMYSANTFSLAIQIGERLFQFGAVPAGGGYAVVESLPGMTMLITARVPRDVTAFGTGPWVGYVGLHGQQLPTNRP